MRDRCTPRRLASGSTVEGEAYRPTFHAEYLIARQAGLSLWRALVTAWYVMQGYRSGRKASS